MARKPATQPDKQFGVRLTGEEAAFLRRERAATGARSLSSVVEEAVLALIEEIGDAGEGACLPVPTTGGRTRDDLLPRQFWFRVATFVRIEEAVTRHGWTRQNLARAALHRLARLAGERDRPGDAPGGGGDG